jgi:RsiW-degrading membrane proteinase PrsW (M82 family)
MDLAPNYQLVTSTVLALIPALVWGWIFYRKQHEDRVLTLYTFALGALSVFPILLYKLVWTFIPWLDVIQFSSQFENYIIPLGSFARIPLSIIVTFMIVGAIEEEMKHQVVRRTDDKFLRSIDDAIEFSIIAALGFAFAENIIYFYDIWTTRGAAQLFVPFVFRSVFSTFAHILFSGIYGYHYGMGHFAKPILQDEIRNKRGKFVKFIHRVFHLKKETVFHEEQLLQGLLISVVLHGLFNVFLEINWTFIMLPFLVFGYIYLSYLFVQKRNRKKFGLFLTK